MDKVELICFLTDMLVPSHKSLIVAAFGAVALLALYLGVFQPEKHTEAHHTDREPELGSKDIRADRSVEHFPRKDEPSSTGPHEQVGLPVRTPQEEIRIDERFPRPGVQRGAIEKVEAHPMSAKREQMNLERRMMERARASMKERDGAGVREAVSDYQKVRRTDHFSDWAEGYEVIASCLESADRDALDAAEEFIETHRGSPLRRSVRRYCDAR